MDFLKLAQQAITNPQIFTLIKKVKEQLQLINEDKEMKLLIYKKYPDFEKIVNDLLKLIN